MSIAVEQFGHVTQLTLDRPDAANAISIEMAQAIAEAIDAFAADTNARVLVVTGAGERSFCAGGDLAQLLEVTWHSTPRHRSRQQRLPPRRSRSAGG
jgi:enoyl-CoA hydratase/carnithine racemase